MKILENYNTAKQKYGEKIVQQMHGIGIPSQYLLAACNYSQEGIDLEDLKCYFQQWMKKESSNEEQNYQVNIFDSVDGDVMAYVTRYSSDGYRGTTIGTRYSDGYDSTEWCVFVGTEEECKKWAEQYNEKHS